MDYPIVIIPLSEDEGGGYMGRAVDLQGCMSDGDTAEEALASTKAAVDEWIELAEKLGRPVPEPGSAARRAARERAALVQALKTLSEHYDEFEGRIGSLEREIQELLERTDNMEAWAKFAEITGVEPSGDGEPPLNFC